MSLFVSDGERESARKDRKKPQRRGEKRSWFDGAKRKMTVFENVIGSFDLPKVAQQATPILESGFDKPVFRVRPVKLCAASELRFGPKGRMKSEVVTSLNGRNLTIAPNQALEHNAYVCHATCGAGVAPAAVMAHL